MHQLPMEVKRNFKKLCIYIPSHKKNARSAFFSLTSNPRRGRREPLEVKLKIAKRVKKIPLLWRGICVDFRLMPW